MRGYTQTISPFAFRTNHFGGIAERPDDFDTVYDLAACPHQAALVPQHRPPFRAAVREVPARRYPPRAGARPPHDQARPGVPAAARPAAALVGITAEQAIAMGLMFAGDADAVYRQILEHRERVGSYEHFVPASRSGFMRHAEATKGRRLFAKEVLPRLREL